MSDELRVQKECKARLLDVEKNISDILASHANTIQRRDPKVNERSAVLFATIRKQSDC